MADIKTRDVVKGFIKTIDKGATATEKMKSAYIQTKDRTEQSYYCDENSPNEYATDKVSNAEHHIIEEGTYQFNKQGQKVREKIRTRKDEKIADEIHCSADISRDQARRASQNVAKNQTRATQQTTNKSIKNTHQAEKTIKQIARSSGEAVKSTAKGTAKTARKSVKTAEKTAKTTIEITQKTVKAAAKATASAVKAIAAGAKALIATIAAGGWVAVVTIIIICLIAMIAGSCFGIFFSNEDAGGQTMSSVVTEINAEYTDALNAEKAAHTYDVLEMSGSRAVWKEVLAVYAVKTATDPDNPAEVATIDDSKKQILKDIFWQMNEISSRTERSTHTEIATSDDGHGNIVEEKVTVTETTLYITVSHKTGDEMTDKYNFNTDQREQLAALLDDKNNSLWSAVLYGVTSTDGDIVSVALSQVGNIGGEPYWSWYGFNSRVEWCACFVSWCANECGYIDTGVIPKYAGCVQGSKWFKDRGEWQDNDYEPSPGDIVFFDWEVDGKPDHTGIVEKCEDGIVYTVEGNSGDSCKQNHYSVGNSVIYGYGIPAY